MCTTKISRSIALIVLGFCALTVNAEELSGQHVVSESESKDVDYRLALGSLRKINNVISASHEQRLSGSLKRITYEFDRDLSMSEAWALTQSRIQQRAAQNVYACDGLECGSSNAWANDQFQIKELYGLDQYQKYRVYKMDTKPTQFLVLYFVVRGNKRIYLQLDTIKVEGAAPEVLPGKEAIFSTLNEQGYFIVPMDSEAKVDARVVESIAAVFSSKPRLKVYLVGHSNKTKLLETDSQQAMSYVEALSARLIEKGVNKARMDLQSLAHLAPNKLKSSERIELVLKGH